MRIGVFCSGGDAPGMNACTRAVVRGAISRGYEVVGICRGYQGLLEEEFFRPADGDLLMRLRSVSNIVMSGGTILGTSRGRRVSDRGGTAEGRRHPAQASHRRPGSDRRRRHVSRRGWRWPSIGRDRSSAAPARSTTTCWEPTSRSALPRPSTRQSRHSTSSATRPRVIIGCSGRSDGPAQRLHRTLHGAGRGAPKRSQFPRPTPMCWPLSNTSSR